jgi:hypothetical protein
MKKILVFVFLLMITSGVLFAGNDQVIKFGIKAGPNGFWGSGTSSLENITGTYLSAGFTGGAAMDYMPVKYFDLEMDIMFTWFNYGVLYDNAGSDTKLKIRYGSIEFPLLIKGRIPIKRSGAIFAGVGPNFVLIMGNGQLILGDSRLTFAVDQIFHVTLAASLGYEIYLNSQSNITFEARYVRGFSSPVPDRDLYANRIDLLFGWSGNF